MGTYHITLKGNDIFLARAPITNLITLFQLRANLRQVFGISMPITHARVNLRALIE